jgi:hypothetical protein
MCAARARWSLYAKPSPAPQTSVLAFNERGATFRWKDYRPKGLTRHKSMTLEAGEFMRRFLLHALPGGSHRIRHYELRANPMHRVRLTKVPALPYFTPELDSLSK